MTKRKTLALIDAENLYYAPKKKWKPTAKLDYRKLYNLISANDQDARAVVYLVADPVIDQNRFIDCLVKIGFIPKVKTLYPENGQILNTNWDDEIIVDGLNMIDDYDSLIMVSGDSDFIPLLKAYREADKPTSVICFEDNFNPTLRDFADPITFLGEDSLLHYRPPQPVRPAYPRPRALPECRFPMQ